MTNREKLMIKKYLESKPLNYDECCCLSWYYTKESCNRYCQRNIVWNMIFNYCRRYRKIFMHDEGEEPIFLDKSIL